MKTLKIKYILFRPVWRACIFAFLFFILISFSKETTRAFAANKNPFISGSIENIADTSTIPYLALGDSYTIGEAVEEKDRFPVQLAAILRHQNLNVSNPEIVAATGWTTGNLLRELDVSAPKKKYGLVTLLIGVNNQYQGLSLDEYKIQFAELLTRAVSYAGNQRGRVWVLSIPDYSVTPFARGYDIEKIAKEIDRYNDANKAISSDRGVHYLDNLA